MKLIGKDAKPPSVMSKHCKTKSGTKRLFIPSGNYKEKAEYTPPTKIKRAALEPSSSKNEMLIHPADEFSLKSVST